MLNNTKRPWYRRVNHDNLTLMSASDTMILDKLTWHYPDGDLNSHEEAVGLFERLMDHLKGEGLLSNSGNAMYASVIDEDFYIAKYHLNSRGLKYMANDYPSYVRRYIRSKEDGSMESDMTNAGDATRVEAPGPSSMVVIPYWLTRMGTELNLKLDELIGKVSLNFLSRRDMDVFDTAQQAENLRTMTGIGIDWEYLARNSVEPSQVGATLTPGTPEAWAVYIGIIDTKRDHIGFKYIHTSYVNNQPRHIIVAYPCNAGEYDQSVLYHALAEQVYAHTPDVRELISLGFLAPL